MALSHVNSCGISSAVTSVKKPLLKSPSPLDSDNSPVSFLPLELDDPEAALACCSSFQQNISLDLHSALRYPG